MTLEYTCFSCMPEANAEVCPCTHTYAHTHIHTEWSLVLKAGDKNPIANIFSLLP